MYARLKTFSALQRAENSSIGGCAWIYVICFCFQCSSASRKFLNKSLHQRCCRRGRLSVLFSEPKIPQSSSACGASVISSVAAATSFSALQRAENSSIQNTDGNRARGVALSVLFSEPKIPQFATGYRLSLRQHAFQCSSASRKFLNRPPERTARRAPGFQCSSASRKFLNACASFDLDQHNALSVLFSEPKIPQFIVETQ